MALLHEDGLDYEVYSPRQRITRAITNPLRNWLLPSWFIKFLMRRSPSPVIQEMLLRPGGWRSMELCYQNAPSVDWLDKISIKENVMAMANRNRRKYVVRQLTRLLHAHAHCPAIHALGIGAGPGLHIQDAIVAARLRPNQVQAWIVDLDPEAFEHGREQARLRGLSENVRFIQGDARQARTLLPNVQFHVVKLVGLIEYLSDPDVLELFRAVREVMHEDGSILTHGLQDPYNAGTLLRRTMGLKHTYRTAEHVASLLTQAGFVDIGTTHIPLRMYPMLQARPQPRAAAVRAA